MTISNIGIIGVGGVGGYFGGKLCRLQEDGTTRISFITRGEHLRAIQANGLQLTTDDGTYTCRPSLATDDFCQLPQLDLCLVCVKVFDLPGVLSELRHVIDDDTVVLPLLNGVDIYTRVRSVVEHGVAFPACVYVGTHIDRPGSVAQKGGACKILFGPDPERPGFQPAEVLRAFDRAGIKSHWTSEIQTEIWQKYLFICAFGLVSAAYGRTLGQILDDDQLRDGVAAIMREVSLLAAAAGVTLAGDVVAASLALGRNFPPEAKTSFLRDFERTDRPDERDLFCGSMRRIANVFGIPIPMTEDVSAILEETKQLPG